MLVVFSRCCRSAKQFVSSQTDILLWACRIRGTMHKLPSSDQEQLFQLWQSAKRRLQYLTQNDWVLITDRANASKPTRSPSENCFLKGAAVTENRVTKTSQS